MVYKPESRYPSQRSYVLKIRSDAGPGALAGRLENVVTGVRREFVSGAELLDWIATDLAAHADEQSANASGT